MLSRRRIYQATVIVAALCIGRVAYAAPCSTIVDPATRLSCYDRQDAVVPAGQARKIDILDFKIDKPKLMGERIEVDGFVTSFGGTTRLKNLPGLNMGVGIYIAPDLLPREDQKRLLSRCETARPCAVTIIGTVQEATFGEIAADTITFKSR